MVLVGFALVSAVTINVYKSVVTNDITAPLGTFPPTRFSQLAPNKFRMIGPFLNTTTQTNDSGLAVPITFRKYRVGYGALDEEFHIRLELWKRRSGLDPTINSTVNGLFRYFICKSLIASGDMDMVRLSFPCSYDREKIEEILVTHSAWVEHLEEMYERNDFVGYLRILEVLDNTKIADEIATCRKSVLVLRTGHVTRKHLLDKILGPGGRSHKNRRPYMVSRDTLFSKRVYLKVTKSGWYGSLVKGKLAGIFEGGLYDFWENLINFVHTAVAETNAIKGEEHVAQRLESNIGTSFIILLIGLAIAGGVVGGECRREIVMLVTTVGRRLYEFVKACTIKRKLRRVRFMRRSIFSKLCRNCKHRK